jgi:hypothetical protein
VPNSITPTNFRPQDNFVDKLSRYLNSRIVYYGKNNVMTFTTYKKQAPGPNPSDRYTVVPPGMEYRPDLVSRQAYGLPDFWWKIMEANGISDVMDFKAGTNLRLPANIY